MNIQEQRFGVIAGWAASSFVIAALATWWIPAKWFPLMFFSILIASSWSATKDHKKRASFAGYVLFAIALGITLLPEFR